MYCDKLQCRYSNVCRCPKEMEVEYHTSPNFVDGIFKSQDTSSQKRSELIIKLASEDHSIINWDYVSRMKLLKQEYESYKGYLNWELASKKISIDIANSFAEYVHWDVFEEAYVRRAVKEARKKVDDIRP